MSVYRVEIIERARSLDDAPWLRKVRLATIVIVVIILALNIVVMPLRMISRLDGVYESMTALQSGIDGAFVLYLLIISVVMLVRCRQWWVHQGKPSDAPTTGKRKKDVLTEVHDKTRWFIATLAGLLFVVLFAIITSVLPSRSSTSFIGRNLLFFLFPILGPQSKC